MAVAENGPSMEETRDAKPNGHTSGPIPRRKKPSSASTGNGMLSIILRLTAWYVIYVALFTCPSSVSDLNETSSRICKPYLQARSHLTPYVQPYYDTYASPYVESARPYVDRANQRFVAPASKVAQLNFDKYAAPRLEQAKAYGQEQWQKNVIPHVERAQKKASELYEVSVAPHLKKVSSVAEPYYDAARDNAANVHQNHILPAIENSRPYIRKAYTSTRDFIFTTIVPYTQQAWSASVIFFDGTFWPKVKGLYRDNVKPQLVMISERIAKYQEGRRLRAVMNEVDSSAQASSGTADSTSTVDSSIEATIEPTVTTTEEPATKTPLTEEEQIAAAREQIASDLHTWQEKFAIAADKGADDLAERVHDIVTGLMKSEIDGDGSGLASALRKSAELEIQRVKLHINKVVSNIPEDASSSDVEDAAKDILENIRAAGLTVRSRANAVRQWHGKFEAEIHHRAKIASDSTLEVLDGIRDLGLQEIGMRWAWMEGVTYKDWAKYHDLKKQFDEWRSEVQDVALKHKILDEAKKRAETIFEDAMDIASDTAKELARLKEVAKWKVAALDSSDDFDTRIIPAAAVSMASKVSDQVEAMSEKVFGTSQGTIESAASKVTEVVGDAASSASSAVLGTPQGSVESIMSEASEAGRTAASEISSSVKGETRAGILEEAATAASESAESATEVLGSSVTSILGEAKSSAERAAEAVSSSASSAGSGGSGMFFSGAMAQEVKAGGPILDDIVDGGSSFSEKIQSAASEAGDRYADVTKAVSEALFGTSQGTLASATSIASEQYSSALKAAVSAASIVIYGTPTPAYQSAMSYASSLYSEALSRAQENYAHAKSIASQQISGTPKPIHEQMFSSIESAYSGSVATASERLNAALSAVSSQYSGFVATPTKGMMESISSMGSAKLQDALSLASAQYSSAKTAVGATPTPVHQQYLREAQRRYYEAVGMAHERYSEFVTSASSAVYGTPTPVLSSLSKAASEAVYGTPVPAYQSLVDAASSHFSQASSVAISKFDAILSSASSALGAREKSPAQTLIDSASSQYSAALAAASVSLSAASEAASIAVYGRPTGSIESMASVASQNWEALVAKASEHVYGAPTPVYQSAMSQVSEFSSQITDSAASQYSALSVFVSELVVGKEPSFTESVMSRFSSAYYEGYHVTMASSASSLASEAYDSAASVASSVSSVISSGVSSLYTTPPEVESILDTVSHQLDAAIAAASIQFYGSEKGTFEQATSIVADTYSSVTDAAGESLSSASSVISEAIYGTQPSYAEAAQSSISEAMSSAQSALSVAIYGTPTGTVESLTSAAAGAAASISSVVSESIVAAGSTAGSIYSDAAAAVSEAVYGREKGALESAQTRLMAAVESAQSKLAAFASSAGEGANSVVEAAQSSVEEFASSVSSVASSVTDRVKDEL